MRQRPYFLYGPNAFWLEILGVICQRGLDASGFPLIPDVAFFFHYLDDYLVLGPDPEKWRAIMGNAVRALQAAIFVVLPKCTVEPSREIFFGKFFGFGSPQPLLHTDEHFCR